MTLNDLSKLTTKEIEKNRQLWWACIDTCNTLHNDKLLLEDRVQWTIDNANNIENISKKDRLNTLGKVSVKGLKSILTTGKSTEFIHLDATTSSQK